MWKFGLIILLQKIMSHVSFGQRRPISLIGVSKYVLWDFLVKVISNGCQNVFSFVVPTLLLSIAIDAFIMGTWKSQFFIIFWMCTWSLIMLRKWNKTLTNIYVEGIWLCKLILYLPTYVSHIGLGARMTCLTFMLEWGALLHIMLTHRVTI